MSVISKLVAGITVLAVIVSVGGWWFGDERSPDIQPLAPPAATDEPTAASVESAEAIDVTARAVAAIEPGTVIGDQPPEGWSHLIIRSHTHVADDSKNDVSDTFARLTSMLFTVVLADVQADRRDGEEERFRLGRLATGVGVEIDGQWIVVSSETQEELGADLGFMERRALAGGEDHLAEARLVARSSTMAVIDFTGVRLFDEKHREVWTRYTLLVDPATGRLETVVWQMLRLPAAAGAKPPEVLGPVVVLPAGAVDDCPLHVDTSHFVFGIPTTKAFATFGPPPQAATIEMPDELKPTAAMRPLTVEAARTLQQRLSELVFGNKQP